jgi:hypothetical protein
LAAHKRRIERRRYGSTKPGCRGHLPVDLHHSDSEPRRQHLREPSDPFLAQRVHPAILLEVGVDQREYARVMWL